MSREIYFCGSIRGGREDVQIYGHIVKSLEKYGEVLTPFVADPTLDALDDREDPSLGRPQTDKEIHDRDEMLLNKSTHIVAEVSTPSLGVGYEIGRAYTMNKKILCLYRNRKDKKLSAMIRGAYKEKFVVKDYTEDTLDEILEAFFTKLG